MARPKKTTPRVVANKAKTMAKPSATKPTTRTKAKTGTATIKLLKPRVAGKRASSAKPHQSPSTKRPPNNPDVPQATIDHLNTMLNDLKIILDNYAQHCQKAEGFLARSLRYAQTPHIYSWSFAKGKTPKLSGYAG